MNFSMEQTEITPPDTAWLDHLALPAVLLDPETRHIVRGNAAFSLLAQYTPNELRGMNLHGVADVSSSILLSPNGTSSPKEAHETISGRILPKEGTAIPSEITITQTQFDAVPMILALFRPRRKSRRKNADSKPDDYYYRELFENANDLIYTTDLSGRVTSANRAILETMGYTLEEALQLNVFDLVNPEYVPIAREKLEQKIKGDRYSPHYELLCRNKKGEDVWLELSSRLALREGRPAAIHGIARDITRRKQSELILKESMDEIAEHKDLLEKMIEQNPFAIAFWNPDGSFHHCNQAFTNLIGMQPDPRYVLFKDPLVSESRRELYRMAFEGRTVQLGRSFYDIGRIPNRNYASKPIWVLPTLFPIKGSDGSVIRVVSLYQDVTQQVLAEQAKEQLESRLQESQKLQAIGTLAGGVAHDFNNLLTGVMGYLELIRSVTDPKVHSYVEKAETVVQRGSDLTRQLLAYARKSRLETRVHDLNTTAQEVSALIRQTVDRRIEIRTRVSPVEAAVRADPGQMNQILLNLCVNARDSIIDRINSNSITKHGDWEPRISIEVRHQPVTAAHCQKHPEAREGMFIRMSVSDNGMGMSEGARARIFEPFFTTKDVGKGTGLGLATVQGIVKQHEGWIEVESELGQGALFSVYLPAVNEDVQPTAGSPKPVEVLRGKETILLVDDEPTIREIIEVTLGGQGYTVFNASDGRHALELFKDKHAEIDLVVLDMTMPRLSGRELLPRLLRIKPGVKIIAMSGFSFSESWPDFHGLGASAFLQKPFGVSELAQTVRRVLDASIQQGK